MMKMEKSGIPWFKTVSTLMNEGSKLGYDPALIEVSILEKRKEFFKKEKSLELVPIDQNLVDLIWPDKPKMPQNLAFLHKVEYAG